MFGAQTSGKAPTISWKWIRKRWFVTLTHTQRNKMCGRASGNQHCIRARAHHLHRKIYDKILKYIFDEWWIRHVTHCGMLPPSEYWIDTSAIHVKTTRSDVYIKHRDSINAEKEWRKIYTFHLSKCSQLFPRHIVPLKWRQQSPYRSSHENSAANFRIPKKCRWSYHRKSSF